jgi:energy-coupling factor transport system permease protein
VIYARRASPLHATRPVVGVAWCGALAACALVADHPLVLGALLAAVVAAGLAARVGDRMWTAAKIAVPIAIVWLIVEPLVLRHGLTVIARLGELPPFGQIDVTLEATVAGGIYGLRTIVVILAFGLYAAAVDPDEVLRLFRRRGMRSALTVTVATRMVSVLQRDAARYDDGRRCRGAGEPSRLAVVRTVTTGALDRALDVSAALELRGYGVRRTADRGRAPAPPWSRHDLAFAASALAVVALLLIGETTGAWRFDWDPRLTGAPLGQVGALSAALLVVVLAPFLDRRGIARW